MVNRQESLKRSQTGVSLVLIVLILGCVALAIITLFIMHRKSTPAVVTSATTASSGYDSRMENPTSLFTVTVNGTKHVSGPTQINVKKGASVRVIIKAVGTEEAHVKLDGYNVSTESAPSDDIPGSLLFIADRVGSFKYYALGEVVHTGSEQSSAPQFYLGTITVK